MALTSTLERQNYAYRHSYESQVGRISPQGVIRRW
jgi:hypothetical protein